MQIQSRLVFEKDEVDIPGFHAMGQYHYTAACPGLPPHRHRGCVEIQLLAKGYQAFQVGGKVYHVRGGEQYAILPDEVHDTAGQPVS
jgi:quercetin dioxygenase-like cupin family protein